MKFISILAALSASAIGAKDIPVNQVDESSYANFEQIASTHLFLDFEVDFDKKQFIGSVEHTLNCIEPTDTVIFDMLGIDVQKVEQQGKYNTTWDDLTFEAHEDLNPNLGNALEISLKKRKINSIFIIFNIHVF